MPSLKSRITAANTARNSEEGSLDQRVYEFTALSRAEKEGMDIPLRLLRNYACHLGVRKVYKFTKTEKLDLVKEILKEEPKMLDTKTLRSVSFSRRASVSSTIFDDDSSEESCQDKSPDRRHRSRSPERRHRSRSRSPERSRRHRSRSRSPERSRRHKSPERRHRSRSRSPDRESKSRSPDKSPEPVLLQTPKVSESSDNELHSRVFLACSVMLGFGGFLAVLLNNRV